MSQTDPSRRQLLLGFMAAAIGWLWPAKAKAQVKKAQSQETLVSLGQRTTYVYDLNGNRTGKWTDDLRYVTTNVYDAQGRLVKVIDRGSRSLWPYSEQ